MFHVSGSHTMPDKQTYTEEVTSIKGSTLSALKKESEFFLMAE